MNQEAGLILSVKETEKTALRCNLTQISKNHNEKIFRERKTYIFPKL